MKNNETYQQWLPLPGLSDQVMIEMITDTEEGLVIFIKHYCDSTGQEKNAKILFDGYAAYRNMDEGYRVRTWSMTGGFQHSLYVVKNSTWLKWLHEESLTYYQDCDITHYVIFTETDCMDILSEFPPEVTWVK